MNLSLKISSVFSKPKHSTWLIGLVVLMISFGSHFKPGNPDFWKETVASDGRGYYAYLPSIILNGEFNFEQVLAREKQIYPAMMAGTFMTEVDGQPVNKYFAGVALLILPFFLLAIFLSFICGLPIDGYNSIFQLMVSFAGIFYLISGLHFSRKLLQKCNLPAATVNFSLWIIVLGTNLLIYTLDAPAMSHVFSFAAVAGFLFYAKAFFDLSKTKDALLASFFLGIIILIRPVNGIIILLLPFLSGDAKGFSRGFTVFFTQKKNWLKAILIVLGLVMIQPVLWFLQTGHWLVWSYQGEGFDFFHPQISKVLFSYQKGFFVYTPVALVALSGLTGFYRKSKWQFFWMVGFFTILIWIVASWWNWYYGDSFGQRVFIDFYAVLALLLAMSINGFRKKIAKFALVFLLLILISVSLIQTWQYSHGIIHAYAMNKAKYWHIFLKTGDEYRNLFSGPVDVPPYKTDFTAPLQEFSNNFENEQDGWVTSGLTEFAEAKSGISVAELNQFQPYSSALLLTGDKLLVGRRDLYAKVEAFIFDKEKDASKSTKLVVSLANCEGLNYYINSWDVNEMPPTESGIWRRVEFGIQLPKVLNSSDQMKIYFWQSGTGTLLVDDFRISVYGKK